MNPADPPAATDSPAATDNPAAKDRGSWPQVLLAGLQLGLYSFGGPVAHLGYFERSYVQQRRWLTGQEFAGIVALCQLLPGPTSSQVGFLIGRRRAGWRGGLAAWVGFTLPSALIMFGCALLAPRLHGAAVQAVLHGLKLAAVSVVAQAVWSMAKSLAPDPRRAAIAALGAAVLLIMGSSRLQLWVLAGGAIAGVLWCRNLPGPPLPAGPEGGAGGAGSADGRGAGIALGLFLALLLGLPLAAASSTRGLTALASIFYRAGALVFGGGHVVLPLLRDALVPAGWLSDGTFLAGYGAAQALPGPLFAFAAYAGAASAPGMSLGAAGAAGTGAVWGAVAVIGIFTPGLLAAVAGAYYWRRLAVLPGASAALAGINASVVGILAAALVDPVCASAISHQALRGALDSAIALGGFLMLRRWGAPPLGIVVFCVAAAWLLSRV